MKGMRTDAPWTGVLLAGGRSRLVFHGTGTTAGLGAVGDMQRLMQG